MGSGPNTQMKILMKIVLVSGNTKKKRPVINIEFQTRDLDGKPVFCNRGRAINRLLNFLFDHRFTKPAEVIIKALNYDREARLQKGKIKGNSIEIGETVKFLE